MIHIKISLSFNLTPWLTLPRGTETFHDLATEQIDSWLAGGDSKHGTKR